MHDSLTPSTRLFSVKRAAVLASGYVATSAAALLTALPPAAAEPAAKTDYAIVEEIEVTARRRAESIQTVPVAVAAFSTENLEMRSVANIADLASIAPNLYVSSGPSGGSATASFFIRGIGQTDFIPNTDPGVGVYLDGVYIARQTGNVLGILEPERVEVLRGPQGTLFGRNTIGGAISITSKRPTGDFTGKVEMTAGNYDHYAGKAYVEFPLAEDRLAGSVSVLREIQDGYGKRMVTGEDMGDKDVWSGRAVLNWKAGEDVTVFFTVDGTSRDDHAFPHHPIGISESDPNIIGLLAYDAFVAAPPPPFGFGLPYLIASPTCPGFPGPVTDCTSPYVTPKGYDNQGVGPNIGTLDVWGVSATVDWQIGEVSLRSITAYRDQHDISGVDYDGGPLPIAEQQTDFKSDQFSQELQLFGKLGERVDWLVGAYYSRETSDIIFDANFLQPIIGPSIQLDSHLKTNSYALFSSVTVGLTDELSVTGGIRYSKDKKTFTDRPDFLANPLLGGVPSSMYATPGGVPIPLFLPAGTVLSASDSWDNVSPKISAEYQATDNAFFYGAVSWGYKSGSYNGRALVGSAGPTPYEPEKVISYELGAKLDLANKRVRLNMAAFQTDYDNIQTIVLITDGPVVNTPTVNAGEARIRGFEAELTAVPVEGLRIDGSLGYVDAEYQELNPSDTFPNAQIPFTTDEKFAQTPEWTAALGIQYEFSLGDVGSLTLRGDFNHRSKIHPNVPNVEEVADDALTLFNARVTYTSANELWQVAVFGTNLTDEHYKTFGFVGFGIASGYFGPPRMYGATLTRRF